MWACECVNECVRQYESVGVVCLFCSLFVFLGPKLINAPMSHQADCCKERWGWHCCHSPTSWAYASRFLDAGDSESPQAWVCSAGPSRGHPSMHTPGSSLKGFCPWLHTATHPLRSPEGSWFAGMFTKDEWEDFFLKEKLVWQDFSDLAQHSDIQDVTRMFSCQQGILKRHACCYRLIYNFSINQLSCSVSADSNFVKSCTFVFKRKLCQLDQAAKL